VGLAPGAYRKRFGLNSVSPDDSFKPGFQAA
jgi:hypothetical protein